ncbi:MULTISPECIES: CvpA family protein [Paenibacillus]|uniref:CvpA family protein n=1 Tax=Paenibacillus TaxID=44249 RepID=UPI0022B92AF6|nr:CvpA family protein [Paenibacillus caseinilyticus]MCZ8523611.1 CvpA family protein [Paenibacillus caseinilyticus]
MPVPLALWNGLDWALLVIAAAGAALGFSRGIVGQLVSVTGLVLGCLAAFLFYDETAPFVRGVLALAGAEAWQPSGLLAPGSRLETYVCNALAFGLLLFGVKLACSIAGRMLGWLAAVPGLKQLNQLSGALLGLAEAALLLIVALHVMSVTPVDSVQRLVKQSVAAPYILEQTPALTSRLRELWEQRRKGNQQAAAPAQHRL